MPRASSKPSNDAAARIVLTPAPHLAFSRLMRPRRLPLLTFCAILCGCAPSFDIAPAEVPNLAGRRVRTTSGAEVDVPARWVATIHAHDGGETWKLMTPDWDGPVQARPIPGPYVARALKDGWSEDPVRFRSPLEGGIGAPGAFLQQGKAAGPTKPAPPGAPVMLWVRDDTDRIVEFPLPYLSRVHVDGQRPRGALAGIVVGSIVGGIAVGALITYVAADRSLAR